MLKIRPQQIAELNVTAEQQFAQRLQQGFVEKYPLIFSRFPSHIQLQIVNNMLNRAKRWGINWKSSLVIFAELMAAIAPNFDQHPQIQFALEHDQDQVNQTVKNFHLAVPKKTWTQVEEAIDELPLYLSVKVLEQPIAEQTASAIQLVLWDKVNDIDSNHYASSAYRYAHTLGLEAINEAPLCLVAWRCLYGKQFNHPEVNPWVTEIMNQKRQPRERIAMLKYRIALDHGRRV